MDRGRPGTEPTLEAHNRWPSGACAEGAGRRAACDRTGGGPGVAPTGTRVRSLPVSDSEHDAGVSIGFCRRLTRRRRRPGPAGVGRAQRAELHPPLDSEGLRPLAGGTAVPPANSTMDLPNGLTPTTRRARATAVPATQPSLWAWRRGRSKNCAPDGGGLGGCLRAPHTVPGLYLNNNNHN